ncbi:MAG: hypothetical protein E1N59_1298 [Puniceicoccaceae bacterium 5H]|nr:MAG: hypothetical protein E1N59_1298 [Puniceicoccaceae bacterium 5H]
MNAFTRLLFAGLAFAGGIVPANQAQTLGVYDSRAIAIAYAGSPRHEALIERTRQAYAQAKAAGDPAEARRLEQSMRDLQRQLHRQAFAKAPVDDLLVLIDAQLPDIMAAADVDLLVSQWDARTLAAYPEQPRVDVTWPLVEAFEPTPRQRQYVQDLLPAKPNSQPE